MKQVFNIAWKDIKLAVRDRTGLILNLAAPLLLTLVMAFAFGGLGGDSAASGSSLADIPVVIVNHDSGDMGVRLESLLNPSEIDVAADPGLQQIRDLLAPNIQTNDAAARDLVDNENYAAAIIIPADFTTHLIPPDEHSALEEGTSIIEIYSNPDHPVGSAVTSAIVQSIVDQMVAGSVAGRISVTGLVMSGRLSPEEAMAQSNGIVGPLVNQVLETQPVQINYQTIQAAAAENGSSGEFDWLTYMAPSMAVMYLMFAMSQAARSILQEKQLGTLPRMLVSPTSRAGVMGGKMLGTYATGLMQMAVIILGGKLLFNINYGEPVAVILFTLTVVAAATAWGMLEAAFSKSAAQAGQAGWIVNLSFAALAGNMIPRMAYPEWMQQISLITPNAWGIETYYKLIHGAQLVDILPAILVLAGMAAVLFVVSVVVFRKRFA